MFMLLIVLIFINLLSFVNAKMLVSDVGVEYEDRILEEFAKLDGTNETFIKIIIYLKNTSEADEILSAFSSNELKDIINRQISDRISVKITEPGFYKLIQDDRVDKVYFARKGYFLNDKVSMNFLLIGTILIIILLIILFYLIFLKSKKRTNKT